MRSYSIKPLALHERVHDFDSARPLNVLTLTGPFTIAEAHTWLVMCVSQIPERCPHLDEATFNFRSTFNGGTQLQAVYRFLKCTLKHVFSKGRAVYRSDNISTIVILRDVISRVITKRQLKVNISCGKDN